MRAFSTEIVPAPLRRADPVIVEVERGAQMLQPAHLAWQHALGAWRWPSPAVATWLAGWLATSLALALGLGIVAGVGVGVGLCIAAALLWPGLSTWRRAILLAGYPMTLVASGATLGMPTWGWLLPLAVLLMLYPMRAWRDAPLYPTPRRALAGLAAAVPLPLGARVLDAGCGLGHGIEALHREWPQAQIDGVEWSMPVAWIARWRSPAGCTVRRGDMWDGSWQAYDVVYLFQRPESMARAWAKACAEMAPGRWLISLDFPIPGTEPVRVLRRSGAQPVHVYRIPGATPPAAARKAARPQQARTPDAD